MIDGDDDDGVERFLDQHKPPESSEPPSNVVPIESARKSRASNAAKSKESTLPGQVECEIAGWHYCLAETGLWAEKPGERGGDSRRVSDPFKVIGHTRGYSGGSQGVIIAWTDIHRHRHEATLMPADFFKNDGKTMAGALGNEGLWISSKSVHLWWDYVAYQARHIEKAKAELRIVADEIGWKGEDFVRGDLIIQPYEEDGIEKIRSFPAAPHPHRPNIYGIRGELEGWRENVAKFAVGNDTAMFCVAAAFTGPLMPLCTNVMGGGFHFWCDSSTGKTTSANMAGSVWGKPTTADREGFVIHLHSTTVGVEVAAVMRNHTILILDELHLTAAKERLRIIYMLAAGRGKGRGTVNVTLREPLTWNVPLLCFDERSSESLIAEHDPNQATRGGAAVRMLDIKLKPDPVKGLFPELHGRADSFELIRDIENGVADHYGVASTTFLEKLAGQKSRVQGQIQREVDKLANELAGGSSSQVYRAATRFALVAVAGELAIELQILPWPAGSAKACVKRMFQRFMEDRGDGKENTEVIRGIRSLRGYIIERMRAFIALRNKAELAQGEEAKDCNISHPPSPAKTLGYTWDEEGEGVIYGLTKEAFKEGCKGTNPEAVAKILDRDKFIVSTVASGGDHARSTKKKHIPAYASSSSKHAAVKVDLYWIKASFLAEED
jgi:hypothetical protein